MRNREAVAAGRFYSNNPSKLEDDLNSYFKKTEPENLYKDIAGIISPHAGYVYSGEIAAYAFSKVDPDKKFKNIFVLVPSHQVNYNGASVYTKGNYETPLGEVKVNIDLAKKLIQKNNLFSFYNEAHLYEHSLEVQLPFIQFWFKKEVKIVPIVIGFCSNNNLKEIAMELEPYFKSDNLFVISSDFSHFPNYSNAVIVDRLSAEAIVQGDVNEFNKVIKQNAKVKGVSTSACGQSAIKILMYLAEGKEDYKFVTIKYLNSGDSLMGDLDRVVGYWAISLNRLKK